MILNFVKEDDQIGINTNNINAVLYNKSTIQITIVFDGGTLSFTPKEEYLTVQELYDKLLDIWNNPKFMGVNNVYVKEWKETWWHF